MTLDVKNRGVAGSGATTVRLYLHKDTADFSSASQIGEIAVPALAAGATASGLTFSFTVPVSTAVGNYFFSYWIDAPGLLLEGNEENNQGFGPISHLSMRRIYCLPTTASARFPVCLETVSP